MHHARTIHRQCLDGCPSYDRFAKGVTAIVTPAKMSVPTLLPGVEQSHAASCLGVLPCDVKTLCVVAHRARGAQVVQFGLTTHRPRNNVVDFERFGTQLLLQLAVFAAELRSLGNELAKTSRDACRWGHRHNARYQCSAQQSCNGRPKQGLRGFSRAGQFTGHVEGLTFELVNQGVEFSAFLGSKRAIIALGKKCRHPFSLAGRHAERAAHALRCRPRLFGSREALDVFQQLPTLRFWQLDDGIA